MKKMLLKFADNVLSKAEMKNVKGGYGGGGGTGCWCCHCPERGRVRCNVDKNAAVDQCWDGGCDAPVASTC